MSDQDRESMVDAFWRTWFTTGDYPKEKRQQRILRLLPGSPRCKFCKAPFHGFGAPVVRVTLGKRQSNMNPRMCNICEEFARKFQGGAEVEMSILFADVRGSTALSEQMSATAFSQLINRFYVAATRVIVESDGFVDKLAGDAVAAFWGAGVAGPNYVRWTIQAARDLLRGTGHGDAVGPWVPVGVGVHVGVAFFGSVGTAEGLTDITAVGEEVNTAARIGSQAGPGEILVSERALKAAGIDGADYPQRSLNLKGIAKPVQVRVLTVSPAMDLVAS